MKNLKFNFALNEMQKESKELIGQNIVLNAPTGSGKTEAILLNLKDNEHYYYFLPTITSCIFMFNRLKELNINVYGLKISEWR